MLPESGEATFRRHALCDFWIKSQCAETRTVRFGEGRRHACRNREAVEQRQHRVRQIFLEVSMTANVLDEPRTVILQAIAGWIE